MQLTIRNHRSQLLLSPRGRRQNTSHGNQYLSPLGKYGTDVTALVTSGEKIGSNGRNRLLHKVEEPLAERGITVSYEAVRQRCLKFGSLFAKKPEVPPRVARRHAVPRRHLCLNSGKALLSVASG